jgi:hypothetical protein
MRRSVAALVVALSTALSVTTVTSASSATDGPSSSTRPTSARAEAREALRTAQNVITGGSTKTSPTMALLHLRRTMHELSGRRLEHARGLLGRPTDPTDPYTTPYSVPAKRKCTKHVCIHWVPTTADAPPSMAWVNKQLKMMDHVWKFEVGKLGYRKPISDGQAGGDSRFDVYLKDLYPQGYYGYCAPDGRVSYSKRLYSGYCVLDNDFARSQYGAAPMASATVTAAHEFFHTVQFAYDAGEDSWMMEATATWMEEQYNDKSNDNRQYLPYGQLAVPNRPLDTFQRDCCSQYANWVFFQYLSDHYGRRIVHTIWNQAAAYGRGAGHKYSAKAIAAALRSHGGFKKVFTKYAAGNITPARAYPEGSHYPHPGYAAVWKLSRSSRRVAFTPFQVHHMASQNLKVQPGSSLNGPSWRLRVKVHGPSRSKAPAVMLVVHTRHHKWIKKVVHLSRSGDGRISVPLSRTKVRFVTVTLANTSTRFHRCGYGPYSCSGVSSAAHPTFKIMAVAYKG